MNNLHKQINSSKFENLVFILLCVKELIVMISKILNFHSFSASFLIQLSYLSSKTPSYNQFNVLWIL